MGVANKLLEIEEQLNDFEFQNCQIGGLLSKYNSNLYRGVTSKKRVTYFSFLKFILSGLFVRQVKISDSVVVIFNRMKNIPQCRGLINPLVTSFKTGSVLYSKGEGSQIQPNNFPKRITVKEGIATLLFLRKNIRNFIEIYERNEIVVDKVELLHVLSVQLTAFINWKAILEQTRIKLVVVDFDRDQSTAPLIGAANLLNIRTITLVHGVINPPYGYAPVLANEIWCWGSFQKKQLINLGVESTRIMMVGNPIVKKSLELRKRENSKKAKIGIALNPMGINFNRKFIEYIYNQVQFDVFTWVVKLHPSMRVENWMLEYSNLEFYENSDLDTFHFFEEIDLLIVNNSSIGYEAVIEDIPVWVYKESENSTGHDHVMIKNGCPDISIESILNREMKALNESEHYAEQLLKKEQEFVLKEFYEIIGTEAVDNIVNNIKQILKDD